MARKKKHQPGLPGLASLREKAGLSQRDLAAKLDLDETAVSHWETGRNSPAGGRILEVADILKCSVDELLGRAA